MDNQRALLELIEKSLKERDGNNLYFDFAALREPEVVILRNLTGIDFTGYRHCTKEPKTKKHRTNQLIRCFIKHLGGYMPISLIPYVLKRFQAYYTAKIQRSFSNCSHKNKIILIPIS